MNTRPKSRIPVDIVLWIDRRIDGKFVRSIGPTYLYAACLALRIGYLRFIIVIIPHEHREFLKAYDVENICRWPQ